MKNSHILVLEVSAGKDVVPVELDRGDLTKMKVAWKRWRKKIESQKLLDIPAEFPAAICTDRLLSLRVTSLPDAVVKSEEIEKKWEGDSKHAQYMQNFMKGARSIEQASAEGIDILDKGYKAD